MSGKVHQIFLKSGQGKPMQAVPQATAVADKGLADDANYGKRERQVLLIEKETLDEFQLVPGQVRENITVTGLPLAGTSPGTRLQVGDTVLEVALDCAPCDFIDGIRPGLREAIDGRRGTLFRVVSGGDIRVGDDIRVLAPASSPSHHHP